MTASTAFEQLLKLATPDRRAVLERLSKQLELKGTTAPPRRGRWRTRSTSSAGGGGPRLGPGGPRRDGWRGGRDNLRNAIRGRVMSRWPEMSSPFHPLAIAAA